MLLLILLSPFLSFIVGGSLARYIGRNYSMKITSFLIGVAFFSGIILFTSIAINYENHYISLGNWIDNGLLVINWKFYIDNLGIVMILVVTSISFLVHIYSTGYMINDPYVPRFMSYLSLFTFFMLILVTGDNFILLFLGWEGVGLCSYLLISFWYTRIQANKAAIKALIVNRISDLALTIGIICTFSIFRSLDFSVVFALTPLYVNEIFTLFGYSFNIISIISLFLFIGAMGKSAQIGLHTWLPDAMEGPTPVSALIHAATMVTAGVFLLIKCSPMFEYAPYILTLIAFIGALTAFISATIGLIQNDIKKVIAYSTCSQLGYMIFICGLSQYHVAFFHLSNHAFFKALLFLSAGAIIHSLSNEQDMRKYGSLLKLLPYTSFMLLIGSLSLMGFPFLTGFYSKDLILEIAFANYTIKGSICYWFGLITAFFTAFYSYRVFFLTFIYANNSYKQVMVGVHELPSAMAFVLALLATGSIILGYLAKDLFVGFGTDFWNQSIFILPNNNYQFDSEFIPQIIKLLPFFGSLISVNIANFLFLTDKNWISFFNVNLQKLYSFLSYKWYFDVIYNKLINKWIFNFAYNNIFKLIDKGLLEHASPIFFSNFISTLSNNVKQIQTGEVYRYGYFMIINFIVYFVFIWTII